MATKSENTDISELQKNVAVMQTDIKYIAKSQDAMNHKLDSMQFPSMSDFGDLKGRVVTLEQYNDTNKLGTTFSNLFASKSFTFVIGLIFAAIIYYTIQTGAK